MGYKVRAFGLTNDPKTTKSEIEYFELAEYNYTRTPCFVCVYNINVIVVRVEMLRSFSCQIRPMLHEAKLAKAIGETPDVNPSGS